MVYYGLQYQIKRRRRESQTLSLLHSNCSHMENVSSKHVFFITYLNVGLIAAF